ncbi:MAG TPA: hypothetical protein VFJ74_05545 [Gemmatimonadaceae bacterium]|nr:hypothetical protein [Gemmatimonadaceae bacterium]
MLKALLQRFRVVPHPALASVFMREGKIFVQCSDRTPMRTAGFWVGSGPVATLSATAEPALVGQAVLDALARSRVEVPAPERGADLEAPLRRAAGVRSRRALMAGTRCCVVDREGGVLRIDPVANGGTKGEARGYRPLPDAETAAVELNAAAATADMVGRAVLGALERATVAPDAATG